MTKNIRYDIRGYLRHRTYTWSVSKIRRKRKGLCREYSLLYMEMCKIAGIPCLTVPGYSKGHLYDEGDPFFTEDHCWNVVKVNHKWYLQDLTWASGTIGFKFNFFFRGIYAAKLRRYPFKMFFKKKLDARFLFSDPADFIVSHYPVSSHYQLLASPVNLDQFENLLLRNDSLEAFYLRNSKNVNSYCEYCDAQTAADEVSKSHLESKNHLNENPRNSFDFINSLIPYDSRNIKTETDTNLLKAEILKYDSLLHYTACAYENIRLEWLVNDNQNKNKHIWFRYKYNNPLIKSLREENKLLKINRRRINGSLRYVIASNIRVNLKYHIAKIIRLQGVIPSKPQSKRDKRRLVQHTNEADKHIARLDNYFDLVERTGKQLTLINLSLYSDYAQTNWILEEQLQQQKLIMRRRGQFEDAYDQWMLVDQDSILSLTDKSSTIIQSVDRDAKLGVKLIRKHIQEQKNYFTAFAKLKVDIREMARHDVSLKEYKEMMRLVDTLLVELKHEFDNSRKKIKADLLKQNDQRTTLVFMNRRCRGALATEYFFDYCRHVLCRDYFRADRIIKLKILTSHRSYLRKKLKQNRQLLKKERRKAERNTKQKRII